MQNQHRVYLDHSASTPTDKRVLDAMLPYFAESYGNPAAVHHFGQEAEAAVEEARRRVATVLNCKPNEIVFTSGGTESDNLAIRGATFAAQVEGRGTHLVTQPLEHEAVLKTVEQLEGVFGFDATLLPVESDGRIAPEALQQALSPETAVVSVMAANNEIGTLQPIRELAAIAHEARTIFHTDAVQAGGQLALDVDALGVDLMSLSGHKLYGPKGVGVLYIRDGTRLLPTNTGGGQENGWRSGTLNVPLIVGMARALEIADAEREQHVERWHGLREQLIDGVLASIPDVELTGSRETRLPSHASFALKGVDANLLLMHLDVKGIAASSGSACKTGSPVHSAILAALGYGPEWAGLRLTMGRSTTAADIERVVEVLPETVETIRGLLS